MEDHLSGAKFERTIASAAVNDQLYTIACKCMIIEHSQILHLLLVTEKPLMKGYHTAYTSDCCTGCGVLLPSEMEI